MDAYGPPTRSPPVYTAQGLLDSINFSNVEGFETYRERVKVAMTPYLLDGLDNNGMPVEHAPVSSV